MHRLNNLEIEVQVGSQQQGQDFFGRISLLKSRGLQAVLDQVFSEFSPEGVLHRLDRLDLDLGVLSEETFEAEFLDRLETELRKILGRQLSPFRPETASLEILKIYSQTGNLPWWASEEEPLSSHLRRVASGAPSEWNNFLRGLSEDPVALRRLRRVTRGTEDPSWFSAIPAAAVQTGSTSRSEGRPSTPSAEGPRTPENRETRTVFPDPSPEETVEIESILSGQDKLESPPSQPSLLIHRLQSIRRIRRMTKKSVNSSIFWRIFRRLPLSLLPTAESLSSELASVSVENPGLFRLYRRLRRRPSRPPAAAENTSLPDSIPSSTAAPVHRPPNLSPIRGATAPAPLSPAPHTPSSPNTLPPSPTTPNPAATHRSSPEAVPNPPPRAVPAPPGAVSAPPKAAPSKAAPAAPPRAVPAPSRAPPPKPPARLAHRKALDALEELTVGNAGLVMFWPFLPQFFRRLQLMDLRQQFVDEAAQTQAVALLDFLSFADPEPPEWRLALPKLLCGLTPEMPFFLDEPLSEPLQEEAERLLKAVIAHATILGEMSVPAFRHLFLQRKGILTVRNGGYLMRVEQQPADLVLNRFPWSWSWVRVPWMAEPLQVEW